MKYNIGYALLAFFLATGLQSCKQKAKTSNQDDTIEVGTAKFAADESFQPIVDEEAYVFEQLNTKAKPQFIYKSENDILRLLLNDSVRVAILSRPLTANETKILTDRTLPPDVNKFAIDAIAIIVNQASNDTLITVNEIKKMLRGETKTDKNIVFDNPNSSITRYLKEFSGSKDFNKKNIYALKTNKEVIRYVSQHPDAIGITGFSWLNDPDKDYADAVNKVKIVAVKDEDSKTAANAYFTPSQNTLASKQYPLMRSLYIINCTGKMGLGTGFAYFILSERGQRIILRSGLLPESIPGREINIKHEY
jgi:phosphate transport system substrate-binding protein